MTAADPAPLPPPHRSGPLPGRGRGTRVWLARHAQVHADWATRSYGPEDVPLSEEGRVRTVELGASLARCSPVRVLSSDLSRASELGRRVASLAPAPLTLDPRLREVDRGVWRGMDVGELHAARPDEVAAFYADPWTFRGHGGESDADLGARTWPALLEGLDGLEAHAPKGAHGSGETPVLVVTAHYNVLRVVCALALGLAPERSFAWRLDKGRASLLEDTPAGWRLLAHNVHDPGAFEHEAEHLGLDPSVPPDGRRG